MTQTRNTAYKLWISDLHNGIYVKKEGQWESNYIKINDLEVSRVNIIATIVQKYESEENNYCSLIIDDSSDTIRVKAWGEDIKLISKFNVGDIIKIVGKPKEYNNEIYLTPELVKLIDDPNWILVRKLELIKIYGKPGNIEIKSNNEIESENVESDHKFIVQEEKLGSSDKRQDILSLIEKLDSEEGVDESKIFMESDYNEDEVKEVLQELLKEGEIYELKPGRIKLLQ